MTPDANPQPGPALLQCKCCSESVNPNHEFCPICNFPLTATEEEQNEFIYKRGYKQIELNELKEKTGKAANTFYFIAGLLLLWGIIDFFKEEPGDLRIYIIAIYGFLAVVFLLLGVWSNKMPIPAIISGLALYLTITILDFVEEPEMMARGLLVRGLIVAGLIRALMSAINAAKIRREHKI